ncbi:MAG: hypothetical protein PHT84_01895 [Candidatus Pacebacteria bacterium]|nr:hypothetical protein [Candidatus Paceibacterota bacterium]
MEPEIKSLLEENLKLAKENNELLKKVREFQRWSRITKVLYWFIIIGIALGAFYFIQPYFDGILNIYSGGVSDIDMMKNLSKDLANW